MTRRQARLAAALGGILILAGCRDQPAKDQFVKGNEQIQGHYSRKDGKLELLTYDSNKDGRTDTWAYMDGATVVRIEIDKDADGTIDRWEYYGPDQKLEKVGLSRANDGKVDAWAFQGPDGSLARIDITGACASPAGTESGTGPGAAPGGSGSPRAGGAGVMPPRITRTEYYEKGVLARAEEDTDCDGKPDKWETFRDGAMATVAFDTTRRGTPDRRLVYGPDGSATLEVDPEGTGRFRPAAPARSK